MERPGDHDQRPLHPVAPGADRLHHARLAPQRPLTREHLGFVVEPREGAPDEDLVQQRRRLGVVAHLEQVFPQLVVVAAAEPRSQVGDGAALREVALRLEDPPLVVELGSILLIQIDEADGHAQLARPPQRHPFGREVGHRIQGRGPSAPLAAHREHGDRRRRVLGLEIVEERVVVPGALDQHRGRGDGVDQGHRRPRTRRGVVTHGDEVDAVGGEGIARPPRRGEALVHVSSMRSGPRRGTPATADCRRPVRGPRCRPSNAACPGPPSSP